MNVTDEIRNLPKVELHRHLAGALPLETVAKLLELRGEPAPPMDELRRLGCLVQPMKSLREVLDRFEFFGRLLDSPEAIDLATRGAVAQAAREGIVYLELRFSPGFMGFWCEAPPEEIVRTVARAAAEESAGALEVPLLMIATRELGPEAAARTFRLAADHRDLGIVGVDLAGDEDRAPTRDFVGAAAVAREAGLGISLHSGETGDAEAVRIAVEAMGAQRIGHGIAAAKDPAVMAMLRERGVPLEISITSNWIVGAVERREDHPVKTLHKAGVPISINTDDPGLFDIDLAGELAVAGGILGLGSAGLMGLQRDALELGFAPEEVKARARARLLAASEQA